MEYGSLHLRTNGILEEKGISKNKICKSRVFDTFSSTHMSLSQYRLYFFVKFEITSSTLCIVVL